MAIQNRTTTITGIFAKDATTTIPTPPVSGVSYRDTSMTEAQINEGWAFKTIVDSSQFNQAMYEYSTITKLQEKYGFLPWSNLTDYEEGSVCLGTNGVLYQAKQATGPSTTAYNPVNDTTSTYWSVITLGGGLEIGDVGIAALGIDETKNRRRYLNGQVISQTQFPAFTQRVKNAISTYPSLGTTEVLWQQEVSNSDLGQCGKFVVDNNAGTIRLPKVVNIQGLQTLSGNLGVRLESGLPNIEGSFGGAQDSASGAIYYDGYAGGINGNTYSTSKAYFDASLSSSIYGNSNTVQPEAIQYPYFIQVATGGETNIDVTTEVQLSNPFFFGMYQWFQTDPNNASWLLSNGQYNAKSVYTSYYDWLLSIYNDTGSITGFNVKDTTDTYDDYDFVLNLNDETFRLPTKVHGKTGDAVVGNGMTLGLNDGTNNGGLSAYGGDYDAFLVNEYQYYGTPAGTTTTGGGMSAYKTCGLTSDPTKSGIEVDTTGMSLYFYVGAVVQDADVINAGTVLNEIATLKTHYVVETYHNGTAWYRLWSDGFCEQGDIYVNPDSTVGSVTINLLKAYGNTDYLVFRNANEAVNDQGATANYYDQGCYAKTGNSFNMIKQQQSRCQKYAWKAEGYISEGENS